MTDKPNRQIAIVGFSPRSMDLWKELPESVEIWTANAAHTHGITRINLFIDVHDPTIMQHSAMLGDEDDKKYLLWLLEEHPFPIYTLHPTPYKDRKLYPLEDVCNDLFPNSPPYITSSVSYLLALAIHQQVDVIHVLGVDAKPGSEYQYQKGGIEHLIGLARGRGIRVILPEFTNILSQGLYGMGSQSIGRQTIEHAIRVYKQRVQNMTDELNATKGAITALEQLLKVIDGE